MAENKFIQKLKGKQSAKSLIEIEKAGSVASFDSMPIGSSDAQRVYADVRDNAVVIANSAINWKIQNGSLVIADVTGDGQDYSGNIPVSGISTQQGNNLWLDAQYTVPADGMLFTANTKWVLKLCGDNLINSNGSTIDFTIVLKLGATNIITKTFTIAEQANFFNKGLVIDFEETNSSAIKLSQGDTITLQLLSGTATASARIYTGMTVLSCLQRKITSDLVDINGGSFEDLEAEVSQLSEDLDNLEEYVDETFVKKDGSSIMTGPLKFRAGSFEGAIAGGLGDGISVYKLKANGSIDSEVVSLTKTNGFVPGTNNAMNIGRNNFKWKDAYIARVITAVLNNGYDIAVPVTASADTLALKSQVDDAANSGEQLYTTGVWYAKMHAETVAPSAENGTNYADFSQVDGDNNPIIVIYERQSGAWVQLTTITPPAYHNGYMTITSKIWDIAEQDGQQGGQVLWSHNQKTFTPYPRIVSFDGANITNSTITTSTFSGSATLSDSTITTSTFSGSATLSDSTITTSTFSGSATLSGESTVTMPATPSGSQIVNVDYITDHADPLKYATNCITEIPQDIKLELDSGTLTLKAGSKVYIPRGNPGVFQVLTIDSDKTNSSPSLSDGVYLVCCHSDGEIVVASENAGSVSAPLNPINGMIWYDQYNNVVKRYSDGVWALNYTFPIAAVRVSSNTWTSIDKVFNGFGYIGGTLYCLPGVKLLAPDGRDEQGRIKNKIITTSIKLVNYQSAEFENRTLQYIELNGTESLECNSSAFYDEETNYIYDSLARRVNGVFVGTVGFKDNVNTKFSTKKVFRALDYNDKEYIANQAMPSNKYIELTLNSSGSTYTAPADGYVSLDKKTTAAGQYVSLMCGKIKTSSTSQASGQSVSVYIPVAKGGTVKYYYSAAGTTNDFTFTYANGAV